MTQSIIVNNIKCGGCANSIVSKLSQLEGVSNIKINVDQSEVEFDANTDQEVDLVKSTLSQMGYPEGDPNMIQTAKSYISCMVGRIKQ